MAYNNYSNPKTIHDSDDGDSQIYVGIKYLGIVAQQINEMRIAGKEARRNHEQILNWLIELQTFYDLVENRTGIHNSVEKIKIKKYSLDATKNILVPEEYEIEEKEKYEKWFYEITLMIERNTNTMTVNSKNPLGDLKYLNNKRILMELSQCQRELMRDANKRHLIMPEGVKDMKQSVRNEWVDREAKKEFKDDDS